MITVQHDSLTKEITEEYTALIKCSAIGYKYEIAVHKFINRISNVQNTAIESMYKALLDKLSKSTNERANQKQLLNAHIMSMYSYSVMLNSQDWRRAYDMICKCVEPNLTSFSNKIKLPIAERCLRTLILIIDYNNAQNYVLELKYYEVCIKSIVYIKFMCDNDKWIMQVLKILRDITANKEKITTQYLDSFIKDLILIIKAGNNVNDEIIATILQITTTFQLSSKCIESVLSITSNAVKTKHIAMQIQNVMDVCKLKDIPSHLLIPSIPDIRAQIDIMVEHLKEAIKINNNLIIAKASYILFLLCVVNDNQSSAPVISFYNPLINFVTEQMQMDEDFSLLKNAYRVLMLLKEKSWKHFHEYCSYFAYLTQIVCIRKTPILYKQIDASPTFDNLLMYSSIYIKCVSNEKLVEVSKCLITSLCACTGHLCDITRYMNYKCIYKWQLNIQDAYAKNEECVSSLFNVIDKNCNKCVDLLGYLILQHKQSLPENLNYMPWIMSGKVTYYWNKIHSTFMSTMTLHNSDYNLPFAKELFDIKDQMNEDLQHCITEVHSLIQYDMHLDIENPQPSCLHNDVFPYWIKLITDLDQLSDFCLLCNNSNANYIKKALISIIYCVETKYSIVIEYKSQIYSNLIFFYPADIIQHADKYLSIGLPPFIKSLSSYNFQQIKGISTKKVLCSLGQLDLISESVSNRAK